MRCVVPVPISNGRWSGEGRETDRAVVPDRAVRRPSRTSSVDGWPPVRHQLAVRLWFGTWAFCLCEIFGAEYYGRRVGAEFVMRKKSRWVDSEEAARVEHGGEEHLGRCLDHRDRHGEAGPGAQLWGVRWEWFGLCFVFTFWEMYYSGGMMCTL